MGLLALLLAADDTTRLGEPDLACRRLQEGLGALGLRVVDVDIVVQAPELDLACSKFLAELLGPRDQVRLVEDIHDDLAALAGLLDALVPVGVLARLLVEVALVPRRYLLDLPRVTLAQLLQRSDELLRRWVLRLVLGLVERQQDLLFVELGPVHPQVKALLLVLARLGLGADD